MQVPTPNELVTARCRVGLSQAKAAQLVFVSRAAWRKYEHRRRDGTQTKNSRTIPKPVWALFVLRTGGSL